MKLLFIEFGFRSGNKQNITLETTEDYVDLKTSIEEFKKVINRDVNSIHLGSGLDGIIIPSGDLIEYMRVIEASDE